MKTNYILPVPVYVYNGTIEYQTKDQIHPLHSLILELAVQEHDLERVIDFFQIDRRVIQEAIVDLMYKEMIFVDLERSLIYVSPEIETYIDRGRLDEFLGSEFPESYDLKWVQDGITGQLMMFDDAFDYFRIPADIESKKQLQLTKKNYIHIKELSTQTLIKDAKMQIRQFIPEGDIFSRIIRLRKLSLIDNRIMYIPIKQIEDNNVKTMIPVAKNLNPNVLEEWTKSISDLDAYTISDKSPVDVEYLLPYDWKLLIENLKQNLYLVGRLFDRTVKEKTKKIKIREILQTLEKETKSKLLPLLSDMIYGVEKTKIEIAKGEDILEILEEIIEKSN